MPAVRVPGAVLHQGRLTIRRSPLLMLHTHHASGVTRTDVPDDAGRLAELGGDGRESPLGAQAYQAYRFAAVPFDVAVAATAVRVKPLVRVQTVLRIAERQRGLESRIRINAGDSPLYRVRVAVPDDLKIDHVSAPTVNRGTVAPSEWSVTRENGRRILSVYLTTGRQDWFTLLIRGKLGEGGMLDSVALPRLEVLGAASQQDCHPSVEGDIVVQVDPAFGAYVTDLVNCREVLLEQMFDWLVAEQRPLARLALHYRSPKYAGIVRLSEREPIVTCSTITNVRISEAAIEDTILLDFTIERAGIRSIFFVLPGWMEDSRITLPLLRQKTVERISDATDAPVRVRLQLEDDVIGQLRVLIEKDRLLTSDTQHPPVPTVETGRVIRRFVTLENAGRDEVVIDELMDLEGLSHQQEEWQTLVNMLGAAPTHAYVVDGPEPRLSFRTKERVIVETAGARIGLAETVLVCDAHGAYRAAQSYRIDNRTEQFLEVELPTGAQLWSAAVAGAPIKPAGVPGSTNPRRVRVPLRRTTAGDLDYPVVLKYGGRMPAPDGLRKVEFPLIRTVNVPVELSQVRLFLPDTYHWLDFGGTMRQVSGEADLAAGHVRYQTKVAERLVQTMRSDSPFAQVRAAANIEELKAQVDRYRQDSSAYAYDTDLRAALDGNLLALGRGFAVSREVAERSQGAGALVDNRARLNTLFENQSISRARNLLQDAGANFIDRQVLEAQQQVRQQRFKQQWLDANQLANAYPEAWSQEEEGQAVDSSVLGIDASEARQAPQVAPQRRQAEQRVLAQQTKALRRQTQRKARRRGTDEALAQYQQQLQRQQAQALTRSTAEEMPLTPEGYADREIPESGLRPAAPAWRGGAAGLASLAVEFPVRGIPFYFTTPRGEVSVKARAISYRFIENVQRIGLILVVVGIGAAGYAASRRWHVNWRESPAWSTLLIGLGLVSLASGVLPVLGAAAIVAGAVTKINVRLRARAARAARNVEC